ncbi:DUF2635 domain-containing protein [Pseudomonas fluorescens group sp. PF-69]
MKVYPVAGLLLRDPVKGDFVPVEGREVVDSPYWFRRLACGDASLTAPVALESNVPEGPAALAEESADDPAAPLAGDESAETVEDAE